jgi:UDP-GlcNAc:undecaprenyl-phosphate GlcNAc-1-phosphate transferase
MCIYGLLCCLIIYIIGLEIVFMLDTIIDLGFTFLFSFALLFLLRKTARHKYIALVDKPNERKLHSGNIPLVGGLSICLSILYYLYNNLELFPHAGLYSVSISILVAIGVLDDKYDISFKIRLLVQAGLAMIVMHLGGIFLSELGNIFGFGHVTLPGYIGQIITIFAVIGAINAFNMVDGIDGLLGGIATVTFAALGFLFYIHGMINLAYFCTVFIVVMLPYIVLNLGLFGRQRKVFMGDAGSMLIGFTAIWLLIIASQETESRQIIRPVTALWLIALPLFDMVAIMIRRVRRGHSPFKPDREHLHHIFQRIGFNSTQTLLAICSITSILASIGIIAEIIQVSEAIMFYLFLFMFTIYAALLANIWKVVKIIRRYSRVRRVIKYRRNQRC